MTEKSNEALMVAAKFSAIRSQFLEGCGRAVFDAPFGASQSGRDHIHEAGTKHVVFHGEPDVTEAIEKQLIETSVGRP